MTQQPGNLYIVATPIGHPKDITLRALDTLKQVDFIICEDIRNASRLFKQCDLEMKPAVVLSEHNENNDAADIAARILMGEDAALISDCGTPVFADPGTRLIESAASLGVRVIPLPGASSLMATLSVLDRTLHQFVFGGFLPRDKSERLTALKNLKALRKSLVIMDTPYRMEAVLSDVNKIFSSKQQILLATDLTLKSEHIYRGTVGEIQNSLIKNKAEFILVIY